tara:strand:- start:154 stop:576 length:423 start_codon:yes stop_codon:yes gene_type:complete
VEIHVCSTQKEHLEQVLRLLNNDLSEFLPANEDFDEIWKQFSSQGNVHSVVALVDDFVVGYGAVVLETKIRGGKRGHIEDIVSHRHFRNCGVGSSIVAHLYNLAVGKGCYKVALQCKYHNVEFYEKCGFLKSGFGLHRFN